jgi:hypothetical protein
MTRVTLQFPPETARRLQERAAQSGQTLEAYLQQIAEREAQRSNGASPKVTPDPGMTSAEEWVAELRAWAASHRTLPTVADDSRESIYEGRGE